jgi:hypothetical protein
MVNDPAGLTERMNALGTLPGDPVWRILILTRLDGRTCTENDIRNASLALPFLSDCRVVIVQKRTLSSCR